MKGAFQQTKRPASRISSRGESGQALLEFSLVAVILIVLLFGVIDFCRAIYLRQVLVNLSRETANLEARGSGSTTAAIMTNALNAAIVEAEPLGLNSSTGMVIVTAVTNFNKGFIIAQRLSSGSLPGAVSRVGTKVGGTATLPTVGGTLLPANRTVYVAEIYYKFVPITPVGHFFKGVLPSQLYDAAYFSAL